MNNTKWILNENRTIKIIKYPTNYIKVDTVNPNCVNCSNHPVNGGSGICHCTLGLQTFY